MAKQEKHNKKFGQWGEDFAVQYLEKKGYTVLARNYTYDRVEVDIICRLGDEIIFVEVKARSSDMMAYPEKSEGKAKQRHMRMAAEQFMDENSLLLPARFDIVALVKGEKFEVLHIEDAFYPFDVL
ncbi:MAG: YraN family protein [Bacteroidota bacterium]